jgi:hypothetical protein
VIVMRLYAEMCAKLIEHLYDLRRPPLGQQVDLQIDAPLRAGENEVIAGGVDSPFVFSVFIG